MRDSILFVFCRHYTKAAESRFHKFTLILSPLRAGRGELERTCLGSLLGDPDTVPPRRKMSGGAAASGTAPQVWAHANAPCRRPGFRWKSQDAPLADLPKSS